MSNILEEKIQQQFFVYFNNKYCLKFHNPRWLILHIPNEGVNNANLTKLGLYPGAADNLIIAPNGTAYFVELKALGKTQRPNQKEFEAHCKQTGVPYYLADNIEDAIAIGESIVKKYLDGCILK
jgi:hypothetical protein